MVKKLLLFFITNDKNNLTHNCNRLSLFFFEGVVTWTLGT